MPIAHWQQEYLRVVSYRFLRVFKFFDILKFDVLNIIIDRFKIQSRFYFRINL